jgi:hypothetical protein
MTTLDSGGQLSGVALTVPATAPAVPVAYDGAIRTSGV